MRVLLATTLALLGVGACSEEPVSRRLPDAAQDGPGADGTVLVDAVKDTVIGTDQNHNDSAGVPDADLPVRLLVFTRTKGWRHDSIGEGVKAVQSIAGQRSWLVDHTEDAGLFSSANLAQYRVVIWLNTTGDVLDDTQQKAFEGYILGGGGYVGVHAACDTEYGWPFYGELVGAYFADHPPGVHTAEIMIEDKGHPSTSGLPDPWMRSDEWYNFASNPRSKVNVLMALDESSYGGGTMGDHPIAWHHIVGKGRAFYTGLGHTKAGFQEPEMLAHLAGAIAWAARVQ